MTQRRKPKAYKREVNGKTQLINQGVSYSEQKNFSDSLKSVGNYSHYRDDNKEEVSDPRMSSFQNISSSLGNGLMYSVGTYLVTSGLLALAFPASLVMAPAVLIGGAVGLFKVIRTFESNKLYNNALDNGFSENEARTISKSPLGEYILEERMKQRMQEESKSNETVFERVEKEIDWRDLYTNTEEKLKDLGLKQVDAEFDYLFDVNEHLSVSDILENEAEIDGLDIKCQEVFNEVIENTYNPEDPEQEWSQETTREVVRANYKGKDYLIVRTTFTEMKHYADGSIDDKGTDSIHTVYSLD